MKKLRTVFMGTPQFAVPTLQALLQAREAGHLEIAAVYTQAPKPAGRGQGLKKSPVHLLSETYGIPVFHPRQLKTLEETQRYVALKPDIVVVAAYGFILPTAYLETPSFGCLNVHASLLPRWRGAAPIQQAILKGDEKSGISIMKMATGMDTGPLLKVQEVAVPSSMTAGELYTQLAQLGGKMLVPALLEYVQGSILPQPQSQQGVTLAPKISKEQGRINWQHSAQEIMRQIHAFSPAPGAFFFLKGQRLKVLRAELVQREPKDTPVGSLMGFPLEIQCGQGAIRLLEVQRAGGTPQDAASFVRGLPLTLGTLFE